MTNEVYAHKGTLPRDSMQTKEICIVHSFHGVNGVNKETRGNILHCSSKVYFLVLRVRA